MRRTLLRSLTRVALAAAGVAAGLSILASPSGATASVPAQAQAQGQGQAQEQERSILVVDVDGVIDPVTADLVDDALTEAEATDAALFVLALDSPGSVDVDVAGVVEELAGSPVPVTAWIKSGGVAEREAAALALAADVVAMASGTRIGQLDESLDGRGAAPRELVPEGVSVPDPLLDGSVGAERAVDDGIADLRAPALRDLVAALDGREVQVGGATVTLRLGEVVEEDGEERKQVFPIRFRELDLAGQLQHALTSPFVAELLLIAGLSLVVFEFFAVGIGIAAAVGGLTTLAAFVGLAHLPVDEVSLGLLLAGFVAISVDVQAGAARFWAVVGTILLVVGSFGLYGGSSALAPPWWQVTLVLLGALLFLLPGLAAMIRARFSTPTIGREGMVGEIGVARGEFGPDGVVDVRGSLWRAQSTRAARIDDGDRVEIVAVRGLVLEVLPADEVVDESAGPGKPGDPPS